MPTSPPSRSPRQPRATVPEAGAPAQSTGLLDAIGLRLVDDPAAPGGDAAATARRRRDWDQMLDDLASLTRETLAVLQRLEPAEGNRPSACTGWNVRDVVAHLALGDQDAVRVLEGEPWRTAADAATDPDEEIDRRVHAFTAGDDSSLAAMVDHWTTARDALLSTLRRVDPDDRFGRVAWAVRPITRVALAQSRVMETWIHTWDVTAALGRLLDLDDRAWWVADLGARSLPYAISHDGLDPTVALALDLSGTAGGRWHRQVGTATDPITVRGPAWAWVILCSRRVDVDLVRPYLQLSGSDRAVEQLLTARAFL